MERLRELDHGLDDEDEWLLVWGYHEPYQGKLSRADLDRVSPTRPIMVWQRSVHEMYFDTPGLAELELTADDFAGHEQADWETGHLWETAVFALGKPIDWERSIEATRPARDLRSCGPMPTRDRAPA